MPRNHGRQRAAELTLAELRARLEREAMLLEPEDQARLLLVIDALRSGLAVDAEVIRETKPAELRE
jgi:hypothetical protein